jgi:hypothetical protein
VVAWWWQCKLYTTTGSDETLKAREVKITKVVRHSAKELIRNLHGIEMLKAPNVHPYENAVITLETLLSSEISPAQRYVLNRELEKIRGLYCALLERGVDLFNMDGYVTIRVEGSDDLIDVLPPVVEESHEPDGRVVKILNDGMHRVAVAIEMGVPIRVVFVKGVPEKYPYYAFPLANGWPDVEVRDDLPEGYVKKHHRIPDYHTLYRNFSSGRFNLVGSPRSRTPSTPGG